jgi:hypothetical protein
VFYFKKEDDAIHEPIAASRQYIQIQPHKDLTMKELEQEDV